MVYPGLGSAMDAVVVLSVVAVAIVVIFDYTNGFHDASNIIATVRWRSSEPLSDADLFSRFCSSVPTNSRSRLQALTRLMRGGSA